MNRVGKYLLVLLGFVPMHLFSQVEGKVSGYLKDKASGEAIIYANIYNHTLRTGTISNQEGYFEVNINSYNDSIVISYIGYNSKTMDLVADKTSYNIYLEEVAHVIQEVTITPDDSKFYIDLILACRNNQQDSEAFAKAYYSLKTFQDTSQLELVEGYYNIGALGYDLQWMDLKTGRLALSNYNDRMFTSLESSLAFTEMDLMVRTDYFPNQPFNLKKRKLGKEYYFSMYRKYIDEKGDSIYVIEFAPSKKKSKLFSGKAWINANYKYVEKLETYCEDCIVHPFLPLFSTDKIKAVDMHISRTYDVSDQRVRFKQVDFSYSVDYLSRPGEPMEFGYNINTSAVLYAYDYENYFFIPFYEFNAYSQGDFRKLNAIPYNNFFWKFNDEYSLNDSKQENETFFQSEMTATNRDIFKPNAFIKVGLFQHPYVKWSRDRVFFKDVVPSIDPYIYENNIGYFDYNLDVKIFLDFNEYKGKLDVLTATIFDPYESFYFQEINKQTHCFINIFFDLCEIMRRKLHLRVVDAGNDEKAIERIYLDFQSEFEATKSRYLTEVNKGYDRKALQKWNDYVRQYLDIDNIALFELNEDK